MLDVTNYGVSSTLSAELKRDSISISIPIPDNNKFMVATGDHVYATIRNGNVFEHVRIIGDASGKLIVDRGQDGTTPQTFPVGSCIKIEWNPAQLCEFVQNCVNGEDKACITPQTICADCNTCFEINAQGRIVSVNKGDSKCH